MKRKAVVLLLGGALTAAMCGASVSAMTYSYEGDGGSVFYVTQGGGAYEAGRETEDEKLADWHKEEMRQQIAYLEKYGISYDADTDTLYYKGKTVRWLIDEQVNDTYMAIQMPEGEIDVYTERASDYQLTGLRVATQEEYDERTRKDEAAKKDGDSVWFEIEDGEYIYKNEDGVVRYTPADGSVIHTYVDDADAESEISCFLEEGAATDVSVGFELDEDDAAWKEKQEEYRSAGIIWDDREGTWTWQGKQVHLLMDEDGSMYQNGSKEAEESKIYLLVTREADGKMKEVKQITMEEVLKERMLEETR